MPHGSVYIHNWMWKSHAEINIRMCFSVKSSPCYRIYCSVNNPHVFVFIYPIAIHTDIFFIFFISFSLLFLSLKPCKSQEFRNEYESERKNPTKNKLMCLENGENEGAGEKCYLQNRNRCLR